MYLFNATVLSEKAINRSMYSSLKIGLFGIGLEAYWSQFEGLKERLEGYMAVVEEKIADFHPHIVNAGLVDTPALRAALQHRADARSDFTSRR